MPFKFNILGLRPFTWKKTPKHLHTAKYSFTTCRKKNCWSSDFQLRQRKLRVTFSPSMDHAKLSRIRSQISTRMLRIAPDNVPTGIHRFVVNLELYVRCWAALLKLHGRDSELLQSSLQPPFLLWTEINRPNDRKVQCKETAKTITLKAKNEIYWGFLW